LDPDEGAVFYGGALDGRVEQDGPPGSVIQRELEALPVIRAVAVCRHLDETVRLIHHGRCGPDALEGVALLAAGGADVVGLVADADVVIERTDQRRAGQAGAVVPHAETVLINGDFDDRWRPIHLAGIQAVINQLLEEGDGPLLAAVTDLFGEGFLAEKVEVPGGLETHPPRRRSESRVWVA
jgi:hypothetical protein